MQVLRSRHELLQLVYVYLPTSHKVYMRHRRPQLELSLTPKPLTHQRSTTRNTREKKKTYLQKLVRLPHACRQILQRDIDRRNRLTLNQFLFVTLQDPKCNPEEDV